MAPVCSRHMRAHACTPPLSLRPDCKACYVLLMQISGNRPVIPEQVPPELAAIITSCWAQKPEDRPTFTEVLVRLDSAMGAMGGAQVTTLSGNTTTEWL